MTEPGNSPHIQVFSFLHNTGKMDLGGSADVGRYGWIARLIGPALIR